MPRIVLALLIPLLVWGCQAGGGTDRAPRPDRNTITAEQLRQGGYQNAYDAVRALHSNWLRTRGVDSLRTPSEVQVYLNGVRLGGIDELRGIHVLGIRYIRYYDGQEATARWGLDHGEGAIQVVTSRSPTGP